MSLCILGHSNKFWGVSSNLLDIAIYFFLNRVRWLFMYRDIWRVKQWVDVVARRSLALGKLVTPCWCVCPWGNTMSRRVPHSLVSPLLVAMTVCQQGISHSPRASHLYFPGRVDKKHIYIFLGKAHTQKKHLSIAGLFSWDQSPA
jgi:hypothetical protein